VFFDELIKLAPDDDAVVGVFAHELGHVEYRHGMQNLFRSAALAAVATWYFGDFTTLANAAVVVTQLKYSRDFEEEADRRAIELMRINNINPKSVAALFRKLRDHDHDHDDDEKDKEKDKKDVAVSGDKPRESATKKSSKLPSIPEFLSTHPDIDKRIENFEKAAQ
ncbi:MAG: M48 family metallopeptidase, partial [Casimicrobium sp.]